jgi:DNA mismatch repair protein MutS
MDGFGCSGFTVGLQAAGALLHYVTESQQAELTHIEKLTPYNLGNYLILDNTSRRNLEITENLRDSGISNTLLALVDRTDTSLGARKIRFWLTYPLTDTADINLRLDAVGELKDDRPARKAIKEALGEVYDLERLIGRISLGAANPRDVVSLKLSLMRVPAIKSILSRLTSPLISTLADSLDEVSEATGLIDSAINDHPPASIKDGGVIKDGFRAELDELREIGSGGKESIGRLEATERERTGISTLKVGYNRVFGYYLSVPRTKTGNIPEDYIRKQTLVNAERYITPELKEFETKVLEAQAKIVDIENTLFNELREVVAAFSARILKSASIIATIDALTSLALVAQEQNYVRPDIFEGDLIEIKEGRHPVVEALSSSGTEEFVPNDIRIDSATDQIHIITGPNMAGKSTFMRQVALIVIMAQAGSFVPAQSAGIGVVESIFTRVGASDDLSRGQSTFMVEMFETANILNNATDKSLILLDEIGRGTSTFDGLSIAWAVAEFLHDQPGRRAKTLFATHYHELTELSLTKERVKNYNISVKDYNGRIIFLRKVVPGGASRSYGIQVAKLAGLPKPVVDRAAVLLKNLESGELDSSGMPRFISHGEEIGQVSQPNLPNLFSVEGALLEHLESIDLDKTTPMEALKALYKLKEITDS